MTSSLLQHSGAIVEVVSIAELPPEVTWTPGALPEIRDNQKIASD